MSYAQIDRSVYEVYQPETPWHAGAKGWWSAPIPGWGQNPNLLDTHRKAIQGLGCGGKCGCKGVGAYYAPEPIVPIGSYYEGSANLPISGLGQDVLAMPEGGCPSGYHQGNLTAGGVSLETPICVKRSFTLMHVGLAAVVGVLIGKML